jgi:hypothetical protein
MRSAGPLIGIGMRFSEPGFIRHAQTSAALRPGSNKADLPPVGVRLAVADRSLTWKSSSSLIVQSSLLTWVGGASWCLQLPRRVGASAPR